MMGEPGTEDGDNKKRLVASSWDRHLLETANSFRHQGELCDINIVTEGGMVCMAHSCMVAAASQILKSRIQEDMDTGLKCHYVKTDVPSEVLPEVLQFIYTGSISVKSDIVPLVTKALQGLRVALDETASPMTELDSYRRKGMFCDLHIVASDDTIFMAHAPVLAAASQILRARIMAETQKGLKCLFLKTDIAKAVLVHVLRFMYTGVIEVEKEVMPEVQNALESLGVVLEDNGAEQPEVEKTVPEAGATNSIMETAGQTSDVSDYQDGDDDYSPGNDPDWDLSTMGQSEVRSQNALSPQRQSGGKYRQANGFTRYGQEAFTSVVHNDGYPGTDSAPLTTIDISALRGDFITSNVRTGQTTQNQYPNMSYGEVDGYVQNRRMEISEENWAAAHLTDSGQHGQALVYPVSEKQPRAAAGRSEKQPRVYRSGGSATPCPYKNPYIAKLKFNITKATPNRAPKSSVRGCYYEPVDYTAKEYKCSLCALTAASRTALDDHVQTHVTPGKRVHQCDQCGHAAWSRQEILTHKKVHKPRKLKCKKCSSVFRYEKAFREHQRTHKKKVKPPPDGRVRVCDTCGKEFTDVSRFYNHRRYAHKERSFYCCQCGKGFKGRPDLESHERIHAGDYRFECPYGNCGKRFIQQNQMLRHARVHTGEKPYPCEFCSKKFSCSGARLRHMRRMHSEHGVPEPTTN